MIRCGAQGFLILNYYEEEMTNINLNGKQMDVEPFFAARIHFQCSPLQVL